MIRVSGEARDHVRRLLSSEKALDGGLRITVRDPNDGNGGGAFACELEVAAQPEPGDAVVQTGGVRLFLDAQAADALDDAELVVEAGELALAVREAAGCGSG